MTSMLRKKKKLIQKKSYKNLKNDYKVLEIQKEILSIRCNNSRNENIKLKNEKNSLLKMYEIIKKENEKIKT